jgi:hypothetical protein
MSRGFSACANPDAAVGAAPFPQHAGGATAEALPHVRAVRQGEDVEAVVNDAVPERGRGALVVQAQHKVSLRVDLLGEQARFSAGSAISDPAGA